MASFVKFRVRHLDGFERDEWINTALVTRIGYINRTTNATRIFFNERHWVDVIVSPEEVLDLFEPQLPITV